MVVSRLAQKGPAHAGEKGPEGEGEQLVSEDVDAHGLGRGLVVADGLEDVAGVAVHDADDEIEGQQAPAVVPPQVGVVRNALEAQGAVGHARQVVGQHADDLGKAQGGDPQVVVAQAQDRKADQDAEGGRPQPAQQDGHEKGRLGLPDPA
ncbi:MAG: hypothetical protein U5J82_12190 [Desulfobacterales bacterium]|nr:hypothetical protein [Desulfobacterales bacterium]